MIRFLATMATMLFLSSAYFLYGAFVVPFTVALNVPENELVPQLAGYQPPVLSGTAAKYFSGVEWLQQGDIKTFQSKETFFYTRNVERDESSGNQVVMSPIAILWKDPRHPEEQPFRLIAEKGIIQFENQFFDSAIQLTDARPGRIVWGTLEGVVHIDGPQGLVIDGQQFVFSEQSGQLYSDYPVTFHYGPTAKDQTEVTGAADQLNISLTNSDDAVFGKDMPRVSGVSLLTLRRNVQLDAIFFQKGQRHTAKITCDGPFEYDAVKKLAMFNNRVVVNHREPVKEKILTETLESERLALQFEATSPVTEKSESGKLLDEMALRLVRALGSTSGLGGRTSQVLVRSEKHELVATMQDLSYDLIDRKAVFSDPRRVVAKRRETTFTCPHITVLHTETNQIENLHCRGAGQLQVGHEKFGNSHAEAAWEREVNVTRTPNSPYHLVELVKNAQVIIPEIIDDSAKRQYQLGLAANQLRLWVDLDKAESLNQQGEILRQQIPIQHADAVGDVALVSTDMIIDHSNHIEIFLEPGQILEEQRDAVVDASDSTMRDSPESSEKKQREPIRLSIDEIRVDLKHDPRTGKIAMRKIDGRGNVTISHQPQRSPTTQELGGDSSLILRGTRVVAESQTSEDQRVTLIGVVDEFGKVKTPAELEFGPTRIKGANLTFDRKLNQVAILGPGAFQIPVSKDLNGKELNRPATLEVVWQERMTFNGLDANFLEAVSCSLKGHQETSSRVLCEDLTVRLNQRIFFTEKPTKSAHVDVELIHAKYDVEIESNKYEGRQLVGAQRGELAEFHVNQLNGNFVGLGPGVIHAWSLGDKLKISPTDSAEANQPIRSEEAPSWRYSRLEFSGRFTGQVEQKTTEFKDQRIKILSAPVEQALLKFREDDVAKVNNAVRLDCRSLKIFQKEFDDQPYWELFAQNVNELEGQIFRAVADELSFDERLGRFILRGIGKDATLYFQERPGIPFSPSSHRYIEFIPKKRSITVDGSSGLSG